MDMPAAIENIGSFNVYMKLSDARVGAHLGTFGTPDEARIFADDWATAHGQPCLIKHEPFHVHARLSFENRLPGELLGMFASFHEAEDAARPLGRPYVILHRA